MRHILRISLIITSVALLFAACKKTESLPNYPTGTAPVLSADANSFAPAPSDSDNVALTFSWTNPQYATDSSTVKYILQVDSSGKDFSNAQSRIVTGALSSSFTAKEFNNMLLSLGFSFGITYSVDVRLISSYANNNDQKVSNVVTLQVTPYVVPAKVLPPQSGTLFLVGSASAGGWGNPVPLPAQQFTRIDSLTYQGTFYLKGGNEYLMLPVNGDWSNKYSVADKTVAGLNTGGDFGYDLNDNFPGPVASGIYTIWVDFQHGVFTVTPVTVFSQLYVAGDYQGWNPGTAPALASVNNDNKYEGYVNVPAGGTYEFKITSEPDWNGTNYGDGGSGTLSTSGSNLVFPGGGYYKINIDLDALTYSITPASTWGVIGSFAGSGWGTDADMTFNSGDNSWSTTITLADGDEFKFRANHDWGLNYGDTNADGSLEPGGDNLKGWPAGTYNVTLYLNNAGFYTYKLVKQ
ncbi:MAG: SusE domain-containing protein [Bacteroidetes bacterium]|nr:SusE domain-containing protein [Bacteroidota bacterium]